MKMNESTVTITLTEYIELVKAKEKINAVERLYKEVIFIPAAEVAALLGLKPKTEIKEFKDVSDR